MVSQWRPVRRSCCSVHGYMDVCLYYGDGKSLGAFTTMFCIGLCCSVEVASSQFHVILAVYADHSPFRGGCLQSPLPAFHCLMKEFWVEVKQSPIMLLTLQLLGAQPWCCVCRGGGGQWAFDTAESVMVGSVHSHILSVQQACLLGPPVCSGFGWGNGGVVPLLRRDVPQPM